MLDKVDTFIENYPVTTWTIASGVSAVIGVGTAWIVHALGY